MHWGLLAYIHMHEQGQLKAMLGASAAHNYCIHACTMNQSLPPFPPSPTPPPQA